MSDDRGMAVLPAAYKIFAVRHWSTMLRVADRKARCMGILALRGYLASSPFVQRVFDSLLFLL